MGIDMKFKVNDVIISSVNNMPYILKPIYKIFECHDGRYECEITSQSGHKMGCCVITEAEEKNYKLY